MKLKLWMKCPGIFFFFFFHMCLFLLTEFIFSEQRKKTSCFYRYHKVFLCSQTEDFAVTGERIRI